MAETTLYLAPSGSDSNTGTSASPWKTLEKARDYIRDGRQTDSFSGDVYVILQDGTYELSKTFSLTSLDSGKDGYKVIYKAQNPGQVIISGGSVITAWTDPDNDGIWQASVSSESHARQLYVNGKRATRARTGGGGGWYYKDRGTGEYGAPAGTANWANQSDIELVILHNWKMDRGLIKSISGGVATVTDEHWALAKLGPFGNVGAAPSWTYGVNPAWVENVFEELNVAGEWYLNRSTDTLYYKPRSGESMTGANAVSVVLPRLEKLVNGIGVRDITFEGLQFSYATWLLPSSPKGYVSIQSGAVLTDPDYITIEDAFDGLEETPGNVHFEKSSYLLFEDNTFKHLGANGLRLGRSSQYNTVFNNTFTDISASSVVIGNLQDHHIPRDKAVKDNLIDNNLIHNVGVEYYDAVGLKVNYTERTVIINNTIHNLPAGGISIGWGWGRYDVNNFNFITDNTGKAYNSATVVRDNLILHNRIYNYTQKLGDTAGIYNLGASPKMRILSNLIHDGKLPSSGTRMTLGIYMDNGTRGAQFDSNGVYNISSNYYGRLSGYFCNGCNVTQGDNNIIYSNGSGTLADMPEALVANAGQQSSITAPRTISSIIASLPEELESVAVPIKGLAIGKTASASINSSTACGAIDGYRSTYWDAGSGTNSAWWQIDVENPITLNRIGLAFGRANADGSPNYTRQNITYQIQTSADGTNWTAQTMYQGGYGQSSVSETQTLTTKQSTSDVLIKNDPTGVRYIRINITDAANQHFGILRFSYNNNNLE